VGYERVEQPRQIGGIPFDFNAMLAGRNSLDLIAVIDLATESDDDRIRRRIEALARALDLVRSRRSLTVVLAGPRRGAGLIQAIAGVARVLTVGTPREEAELRDALAVLLPLEVTPEDTGAAEVWAQARDRLLDAHLAEVDPIITAAARGQEAVTQALAALLAEPLQALWETEEEDE
jgi:hypothetical protein